ncbi:MAG: hypothetical protein O2930_06860 [Acidobacteria bacterium]|nr:hypothetical protein [Acidobacteriota bacterium]
MNYVAHAMGSVEDPYWLAGTAVPDWIRVSDHRSRVQIARLRFDSTDPREAALASGVQRHFDDDRWFHRTSAFHDVSDELTMRIAALEPENRHMRAFFLGHVLLELLLDAALIERDPAMLPRYYASLAQVDVEMIGRVAGGWTEPSAERLVLFAERFRHERFLFDYLDDRTLLHRLTQISRRVRLTRLPDGMERLLPGARALVRGAADALMTRGSVAA